MARLVGRWIWRMPLVAGLWAAGCDQPQSVRTSDEHDRPERGSGHARVQAIALILPPIIDGKLDEGIWRHTRAYSDFVVLGGPPRPARRRTAFRIAYDAGNLYVALMCPTDTSIGPPKVRHWQDDDEAIGEDESCRVRLWPEPNRPEVYFELTINPQGAVCDARRHWGHPIGSTGWDGPTQAAATISRGAWQAELRVPLQRLGIPDRPWAVNVIRHDALAAERSSLAPAVQTGSGGNLPARAALQWPMPARPFMTWPLPIRRLRLADMEGPAAIWETKGATVVAGDKHVRNGRRSLQVSYQAGGGRIVLTPRQVSFSGFQTLRFDAFVDGGRPIDLGVRLRDALGRSKASWFLARPGANDVVLPLDLLGAGLRLRNIKTLELLSRGAARVWIDHLRLEEDTVSHHERPHHPARPSRSSLEVRIDPTAWAGSTSTPVVAIDVTVPLFRTQKVRRLQRRPTTPTAPARFRAEEFAGHDARDPVRVTAFLRKDGRDHFAFRELRLTDPQARVTFGPRDFPLPMAESAPAFGSER